MPDLYTPKELALRLKKSPKTIRAWIASGYLHCLKCPDGSYLIPEASVLEMLRPAHPKYDTKR